ncbi:hypothetical protein BJ165DRAFT_1528611 [Panaeolus papilionaceus]|nr:hypothetical protein BJ165DRAFT_1528611 [Panaeolus papilionaceus]
MVLRHERPSRAIIVSPSASSSPKSECPPSKDLVQAITGEQEHNCSCSAETTKPAPAELPIVKPVPIPEPVEPPIAVKPVPAPPAKPSIVPPPATKGASWIWTPEYKINSQPPVGTTRTFPDKLYTIYVNSKLVGSGKSWIDPDRYTIRFEPTTDIIVAVIDSQGAGQFIDPTFIDASWIASHVIGARGTGIWKDITPATPGKAAGQKISESGIPRIPDAPNVSIAEE